MLPDVVSPQEAPIELRNAVVAVQARSFRRSAHQFDQQANSRGRKALNVATSAARAGAKVVSAPFRGGRHRSLEERSDPVSVRRWGAVRGAMLKQQSKSDGRLMPDAADASAADSPAEDELSRRSKSWAAGDSCRRITEGEGDAPPARGAADRPSAAPPPDADGEAGSAVEQNTPPRRSAVTLPASNAPSVAAGEESAARTTGRARCASAMSLGESSETRQLTRRSFSAKPRCLSTGAGDAPRRDWGACPTART